MMPEHNERLITCFRTVFPDLTDGEIAQASMASLAKWDSLATVMLISVIEEEYQLQVADDDLQDFVSFELIDEILRDDNEQT
ncbi:MAG: hypothetical protein L3J39_07695 [Verrucomicrobiales bacterium]|nr:hypothetical protein [Verrucomicrobiales bacterium]